MDITQFAKMFPQKMAEVRKYVEGEGVKIDMGRIALDHFDETVARRRSAALLSELGFGHVQELRIRKLLPYAFNRVSIRK